MNAMPNAADVLRVGDPAHPSLVELVRRYGAELLQQAPDAVLPGSYWGESEAGLRGNALYVRADTPWHSVLHELSHYACMTPERRASLDRDAGGDDAEECAVCYLQIVLAAQLAPLGRELMLRDMDSWGYTFRFGSARAWFESDAADARLWLQDRAIIDGDERPTGRLRP